MAYQRAVSFHWRWASAILIFTGRSFPPRRVAATDRHLCCRVNFRAPISVAGTLEPFFLENATRWADALRGAGADVVMTERVGDHGDPFWQAEFVLMVGWAFGR